MDDKLQEQISNLPRTAGVYLFYAKKSADVGRLRTRRRPTSADPIYIGKAINIRDRVKNHFMQPSYRDNLFIERVSRVEFTETKSEIEALVLEAQLIKKHLPKFNVVWKDDKNYFYVAFEKNAEGVPFLKITHQPGKTLNPKLEALNKLKIQNQKTIGPFVEGGALKKILKYLRRVFPYYTSARHPKTPCTWCHLGLCPGPDPDIKVYKSNLKKLALILQGKRKDVLFALRREMEALAKNQKFEEAGNVRDKMLALERIMEHTHVIESEKLQVASEKWLETEKILQGILNVPQPISKIECYDISNIQGKQAVGSMVVFVDGAPDKSQYKKFRIRMKNEPNDIAMLKEVLERRLKHPEWQYPQVMLIDGGIAQLNVAIKAKGINSTNKTAVLLTPSVENIKVISIAKGRQELFIEGHKKPIPLKQLPQDVYNTIKHLDDEAHRFAVRYHTKVRKKQLLR